VASLGRSRETYQNETKVAFDRQQKTVILFWAQPTKLVSTPRHHTWINKQIIPGHSIVVVGSVTTTTKTMVHLRFDPTIRIVNADNSVTERLMNRNGGYYYDTAPPSYDDDEEDAEDGSLSFGGGGGGDDDTGGGDDDDYNNMEYLDAVEDEMDHHPAGDLSGQFFDANG
jgi:hypothetical protein